MNEDEQEKKLEQELREGLEDMEQDDLDDQTQDETPTKAPEPTEETKKEVSQPQIAKPAIEKEPRQPEPVSVEPSEHSSAGVVILQWLSYAFWAWLVIGLIWLVSLTLTSLLLDEDTSGAIPYALAASLVLLPVAFVVDRFYRRHEPLKKRGAAMVIMVIHAVLYALATIGTLIGAVFIALNMFINDSLAWDSAESVVLYTTVFAALSFGYVFLRVLNPFQSKLFSNIFGISMLVISAALIVLGFVGPALSAFSLRNDRLIESGLGTVSSSIISYVNDNEKLPESLNDLELRSDSANSIVEKGLVTYKPEGKVDVPADDETGREEYSKYRYQLCVTFNKESKYPSGGGYYYDMPAYPETDGKDDDYQTYPDVYDHKAGDVCYKLETYNYKDQPIGL